MCSLPDASPIRGSPPRNPARWRLKVLVYGAGPIGCLYAAKLYAAGEDVTLLARGQRLADLRDRGVVLEEAFTGSRQTVRVPVTEALAPDDAYDLVIVPMRKTSVGAVLPVLAANTKTPTILFMVNTASGPDEWIVALGRGRVLLGFPGAGGTIRDGVLRYGITPGLVQATTLGETDGRVTPRLEAIAAALRHAGFPVSVCPRMEAWLKTHVALVGPVAWALYAAAGDNRRLARTPDGLVLLARAVREGFAVLRASHVPITPARLRVLEWLPEPVLVRLLAWGMRGRGAEVFLAAHANAIRDEMAQLAVELAAMARAAGISTPAMDRLAQYTDPRVEPLPIGSNDIAHLSHERRRLLHKFDSHARRLRPVLTAGLGPAQADAVMAETRRDFDDLIPAIPFIGGRSNPLTWNLESSAMFLALYRVLKRRGLGLDDIGQIAYLGIEAWLRGYPPLLLRLVGWWRFTPWYLRSVRRRAARSQARHFPGDWVYRFVPGDGRAFDWGIDYTACGILKFYRAQGAEGFMRSVCPLDIPMGQAFGLGMRRTGTLAGGAPCCDFRFKRGHPTRPGDVAA
jgi:2-dehydropantoate 2-reductase